MKRIDGRTKFLIILCLCVGFFIMTGTTFALVYHSTESRVNNVTVGNLKIDLTEPKWDDLTEEDRTTYPGRTITKDPRVTNNGSVDAYLYIEVHIPRANVKTVNAYQTINPATEMDLFTYTVNPGWTPIGNGEVSSDGKYSTYIYGYTNSVIAPNASTPTLFDSVTFANTLEGQPPMNTLLKIELSAIGIQADYLNETGETLQEKIVNAFSIAVAQDKLGG